jgi:hypothetical protein
MQAPPAKEVAPPPRVVPPDQKIIRQSEIFVLEIEVLIEKTKKAKSAYRLATAPKGVTFPKKAAGPCFEYSILMCNWIKEQIDNGGLPNTTVVIRQFFILRGPFLEASTIFGAYVGEQLDMGLIRANYHVIVEVTTVDANGKSVTIQLDAGLPAELYWNLGGKNGVIPPGKINDLIKMHVLEENKPKKDGGGCS